MKEKLYACFKAGLLMMAINSIAYTQGQHGYEKISPHTSFENHIPSSKQAGIVKGSGHIFRNNISTRAVRSFIRSFDSISDVKWYPSDDGYTVHFTRDSIKTRVNYRKNGEFKDILRYYYENKLVPEIRQLVKSKYYDFSIRNIVEWYTKGQTIYEIKMEDKISMKIIKIVNGEIASVMVLLKAGPL